MVNKQKIAPDILELTAKWTAWITEISICVVQELPSVTDKSCHVGQTRIAIWNAIKLPLIVECIEQVVVDSNYQLPCSTY